MNEENFVELETTKLRKNVNEEKRQRRKWRIGKKIAGSEMEERREDKGKAAPREKERISSNIKELITVAQLGWEEEKIEEEEKNEKGWKRERIEIQN